jgi:hypothetical protein
MTRNGDFDFDLPFRHEVFNAIEQENRIKSFNGNRKRYFDSQPFVEEPARPIFEILNEFMDEKMCRVVKQDPLDAMRALRELRWVLRDLVHGVKHPEFKPMLELIEATGVSIAMGWCQLLVKEYRDPATPREELPKINAALVECIECGAWPTWKEDIDSWAKPWGGDDGDCAA